MVTSGDKFKIVDLAVEISKITNALPNTALINVIDMCDLPVRESRALYSDCQSILKDRKGEVVYLLN